jgi:hypothetical protein
MGSHLASGLGDAACVREERREEEEGGVMVRESTARATGAAV